MESVRNTSPVCGPPLKRLSGVRFSGRASQIDSAAARELAPSQAAPARYGIKGRRQNHQGHRTAEAHWARQHGKSIRVIRCGIDETDEPAIHREGIEPSGERLVIIV